MSDLIKREDVIATIGVMYERCDTYDITDYRDLMLESVKVLLSADRPQGMWELVPCTDLSEFFEGVKNGFRYRCSNCKDERRWNKLDMNFCPNCGARMKGADDDSD